VVLAKFRSGLTYGNVMATVAVFIALGGSSYAALRVTSKNVPKNALTGADIKNLTGKDVRNNSLTGADVKGLKTGDVSNGSLLAEDFAAGQFPFLTASEGDNRYLTAAAGDARYLSPSGGDARYLTASQGDGRYSPASGEIRLNASPMTWENTNATSTAVRSPDVGGTGFGDTPGATTASLVIEPTLPTVLLDRPLTLIGVNACYATTTDSTLTRVRINTTTNTTGIANGGTPLVDDTTARTDNNCRDYTLPTPHVLATNEDVSLQYDVSYSQNAASFTAGRATFIFRR
jgi:hypothetical protein